MEPRPERPAGAFETLAVHASTVLPDLAQQPVAPPIWPVATWATTRSAEVGELLEDRLDGYVYGRYDNPTNTALHTAVAALHSAPAAWSFASGTAAIHAVLDSQRRGGRLLVTKRLYGGTYALLRRLADDAGWGVDAVDLSDPANVDAALTDEHTVLYAETIANPSTQVADLGALADRARTHGLTFIVDNTFASPWLCRPLEHGADVVIESATKYLGGHGDVVAGVIAGSVDTITAGREAGYEFGGSLGPFEAWLVARGIQTLALRMERSSRTARSLAEHLEGRAGVVSVAYPTLPSHPQHDLAVKQFAGRGGGGIVAVDLGDRDVAERVADACRVFLRAASLGGTRSLVLHPASTSHRQLSDDDLVAAGVGPGLLRLSVGIEDLGDLRADLDHALATATTGDVPT